MTTGISGQSRRLIKPLSRELSSVVIAFLFIFAVSIILICSSEKFFHWFIVPIALCGTVICCDLVDWFRGRYELLDPVGLIGLLGIYEFFISPLLIVLIPNFQLLYLPPLDDWRPWLGGMAVLNFLGLMVYRFTRQILAQKLNASNKPKVVWRLNMRLLPIFLGFGLLITAALQVAIYAQVGGIVGYISVINQVIDSGIGRFNGYGALFSLSESFPILLWIAFAVYWQKKRIVKSWLFLTCMLVFFFALRLLFGGFRGSRGVTIYAVFWAVAVIHLWIRNISRRVLYFGVIFLVVFMYTFGFLKALGSNTFDTLENTSSLAELESQTNRTLQGLLISDLSRADIQAYLLYRLSQTDSDYQYAWGASYIGGLVSPIPTILWPNKPPGKVKEGTEALQGRGMYDVTQLRASQIYGLAGEAMLNFTPLAIPIAFIALGLAVAYVRYWLLTWDRFDSRRLILPFLVIFCFFVLINDSDNNTVYLAEYVLVPFLLVFLSSSKLTIQKSGDT